MVLYRSFSVATLAYIVYLQKIQQSIRICVEQWPLPHPGELNLPLDTMCLQKIQFLCYRSVALQQPWRSRHSRFDQV